MAKLEDELNFEKRKLEYEKHTFEKKMSEMAVNHLQELEKVKAQSIEDYKQSAEFIELVQSCLRPTARFGYFWPLKM